MKNRCGLLRPVGVVADVASFDNEDDVLGDIRGVVADALQMTGDENQLDSRLDLPGSPSM